MDFTNSLCQKHEFSQTKKTSLVYILIFIMAIVIQIFKNTSSWEFLNSYGEHGFFLYRGAFIDDV